jgi:hypothetical protein
MSTQIEFLNYDYTAANAFLNDNNKHPHKESLGFFDESDGAGQFYWFDNEQDLKNALLNGWYARDTEERDADYYDSAMLLKVYLELNKGVEKIWKELPAKLNTEQQLLWSGNIYQLLTDENDFAVSFREEFKDFLISKQFGTYENLGPEEWNERYGRVSSDKNPDLLQNKINTVPLSPELLEVLFEYLSDYCWG